MAAGYLAVGAGSGFGDWPVILPALNSWPARLAAIVVAAGGYVLALRALARLGVQRFGVSLLEEPRLTRVGLLPALAAGAVAVMAELVGRRFQPLGLALALGCTTDRGDHLPVRRSLGWILGGAAAAVGFIALVGPAFGS